MAVKRKAKVVDEEIELGEDDEDFVDDSESEFDESLGDEDVGDSKVFDESFDDFDVGLRNQPDVYRIWLDTSPHLRDMYLSLTNQTIKKIKYIKGGKTFYKTKIVPISYKSKEDGKVIVIELKPLANEMGVSQIMANFKAFVSSPIVQGNLDKQQYHRELMWYSEKFTVTLWTNRKNWDINIHDVTQINTMVIGSVELFLTRLIGNLERGRERANPNMKDLPKAEGVIDKIAFWRKEGQGRA